MTQNTNPPTPPPPTGTAPNGKVPNGKDALFDALTGPVPTVQPTVQPAPEPDPVVYYDNGHSPLAAPAGAFPEVSDEPRPVTSVSVSWLASRKVDGQLFSYTPATTFTFAEPVTRTVAAAARASLLTELIAEGERVLNEQEAAWRATRPAPKPQQWDAPTQQPAQQLAQQQPATQAGAQVADAAGIAAVAAGGSAGFWATGKNPRGGDVPYITTAGLSVDAFRLAMEQSWARLGYSPHVAQFFDNRIGDRGLQAGVANYSPGGIRLKEDAPGYAQLAADKKLTIGYVSFDPNGNVVVKVAKDYDNAVSWMRTLGVDPFAMPPEAGPATGPAAGPVDGAVV